LVPYIGIFRSEYRHLTIFKKSLLAAVQFSPQGAAYAIWTGALRLLPDALIISGIVKLSPARVRTGGLCG
jgi:hypothetical protein